MEKAKFEFIIPNEHKTLVEEWFKGKRVILEVWDYSNQSVLGIVRCTKVTFDAFADYAASTLRWCI